MQASPDSLDRVLRMFKHYGCYPETLLTKQKLTEILNKQATINLHRNFSSSIIEEIWGQTQTTSRGQSAVLTFAKIFSQAMKILEDRISVIEGPTGIMQKEAQLQVQQNKLKDLESKYQEGYQQDYDKINVNRRNITIIEGKIKQLKQNKSEFERDLNEMRDCLDIEEVPPSIQRSNYIVQSSLDQSISPPGPSPHLTLIFKVTVITIMLQMLFLAFRKSFLALLCDFLVIFWLFLGYYDKNFVKMLIIGFILSCLLDVGFACLQAIGMVGQYWHPNEEIAWVYVSIVFLIVDVALRILIVIKLCIFRQPSTKKEYFILFDHEIYLNIRSGKMHSSQKENNL